MFGVFCFGLTWEGALFTFEPNGLEAMLACLMKTFWKRCWHVYVQDAVPACFRMFRCGPMSAGVLCMFGQNGLEAMLACLGMFRFGPTWEEALCMLEHNGLEAMLACFGMFRFGPTWDEALCIFEQNGLEAMWHVSLWPNVGRGLVHV